MDRNNTINIAIIGEVSVGKTTLLNSMFVKIFSDSRIVRSTMSANIYCETKDKSKVQSADSIFEKNKKYEESMKDKLMTELKENTYMVAPSISFGDKLANTNYDLNVIDIPGLNDNAADDVIKKWLDDNFNKFSIIFFVNWGLRTKSELDLFKYIVKRVNSANHIRLYNIINKYDDPDDSHMKEMKEKAEKHINDELKDKNIKSNTFALSAELAYSYRYVEHNKTLNGLSQRHRELLVMRELGKKATKYKEDKMLAELKRSIDEGDNYCSTSGYGEFINHFQKNVVDNIEKIYYDQMLFNIKQIKPDNLNAILNKYKVIQNLNKNKVADKYLETLMCNYINNLADKKNENINIEKLLAIGTLINNNLHLLKDFTNINTLAQLMENTFTNYITNGHKVYPEVMFIDDWLQSATSNKLITPKYIQESLITFYNNRQYPVKDFSKYKSHIEKALQMTNINKKLLIEQYLIYVVIGIHYENISFCNNGYSREKTKLIFDEWSKYNIKLVMPALYLKLKLLNSSKKEDEFITSISKDINNLDEFINSIDPGFYHMLEHTNSIYQKVNDKKINIINAKEIDSEDSIIDYPEEIPVNLPEQLVATKIVAIKQKN